MIKKLGIFVLIIVIIIVGFKGIRFVRDQLSLKYAKEEINWIENYYTMNAHYPSDNEFVGQFSKIKLTISSTSYRSNSGSVNNNSPQDFSLEYRLSKEVAGANGVPERQIFGYTGHYLVKPCARSISGYYFNRFATETYTNSDDWIYTDIYSGEVYSVHSNLLNNSKSNGKISLLSGLNKPRIFSWVSPLDNFNFDPSDLNNQVKYKNKVFITNGSDIFSYDWDSINLKLNNPQKIGEIPNSCSEAKF